jgi:hypothetical protein
VVQPAFECSAGTSANVNRRDAGTDEKKQQHAPVRVGHQQSDISDIGGMLGTIALRTASSIRRDNRDQRGGDQEQDQLSIKS